jgi:O-antigen chain-terminating methyltransferase
MIEANNPEINVNELMKKIREEVAKRNQEFQSSSFSSSQVEPSTMKLTINQIEAWLRNAEARAYIRTKWPDKLNQFPFNLSKGIQKLVLKILNFIFKDQREVNFNLINSLKESITINLQLISEIAILRSRLETLEIKLDEQQKTVYSKIENFDKRLVAVDSRIQEIQEINENLDAVNERVQGLDSYLSSMYAIGQRINEDRHLLDALYVAFEDRFRGSREEIRERLKVYLPLLEQAKVGTCESSILDLGCGRGEWLELLRDSGFTARGIDINRIAIEQCRTRGLEAIEADVIAYLQSLPDASLSAVTGFHIIEHLPFEALIKLFDETVRVLNHGGLAIFETPNPENVLVGSYKFYLDPTHRNPLPSSVVKFLAQSRGLSNVTILKLHPYPDELKLSGSELAERFNEHFYGAQDYAVIGYKA